MDVIVGSRSSWSPKQTRQVTISGFPILSQTMYPSWVIYKRLYYLLCLNKMFLQNGNNYSLVTTNQTLLKKILQYRNLQYNRKMTSRVNLSDYFRYLGGGRTRGTGEFRVCVCLLTYIITLQKLKELQTSNWRISKVIGVPLSWTKFHTGPNLSTKERIRLLSFLDILNL